MIIKTERHIFKILINPSGHMDSSDSKCQVLLFNILELTKLKTEEQLFWNQMRQHAYIFSICYSVNHVASQRLVYLFKLQNMKVKNVSRSPTYSFIEHKNVTVRVQVQEGSNW